MSTDVSALLEDLPEPFDRGAFVALYAEASAIASTSRAGVREPFYRLRHGHRVARLGLALLQEPDVPREDLPPDVATVVWIAGLVHDLFKEGLGADPDGRDHAAVARDFALDRLPSLFGSETAARVAEAAFLHNKRQLPAPAHARVVQDADLLDHFGAQEIWLAAYVSAFRGESLEDCLAYLAGETNGRWRRYALEHVHFESARRSLRERLAYADQVTARLAREARGALWPSGPAGRENGPDVVES